MIMYSFMCYFLQIGTTSLLQSTEPKHSKNTTKKKKKKKGEIAPWGYINHFFSSRICPSWDSAVGRNRDRLTSRPTQQAGRQSNSHILQWEETETDRQADQHDKQADTQTHTSLGCTVTSGILMPLSASTKVTLTGKMSRLGICVDKYLHPKQRKSWRTLNYVTQMNCIKDFCRQPCNQPATLSLHPTRMNHIND